MWNRIGSAKLTRETIAGTATLVCASSGWVIHLAGKQFAAGDSFDTAERALAAAIVKLRPLRKGEPS